MKSVLIACDSAAVRDEVKAVLSPREFTVREVVSGAAVLDAVAADVPDLVISDLQLGNKGGIALTLDLRLEESADRLPYVPVLLLLDRRADVFLARRSEADGFVIKPLDPVRLRRAITAVLSDADDEDGQYEDPSYQPAVSAAAPSAPLG